MTATHPRLDSIIISISGGALLGLILIAQGRTTDKQFTHPMHSPNDRSRFATVRALVDQGTYAIGALQADGSYEPDSVIAQTGWDTIDKVRRPSDGLIFSSKPPLLPTLLAGEYWLIKKLSDGKLSFTDHPLAVVRLIVATINWVPYMVFLLLFSRLLDRLTTDLWVRTFALATAAAGTYLTGFSVTLNNHTLAAYCSFCALYPALLIWWEGRREWWLFALAGLLGAFTATIELPAVALAAAMALGLLALAPARTISCFLPAAIIPIAAHCYTTYQITGDLLPAYEKKEWYEFPGSYWKIDPNTGRLVGSSTDPATGKLIVGDPKGIDNQFEPWYVYVFHLLVGHHGVFSLSPVFLLSLLGSVQVLTRWDRRLGPLALLALVLTVMLFVFYVFLAGTRNYGGMCNGPRWLFWVIPVWLIFLVEGLVWIAPSRMLRTIAAALLLISAASAFYATRNPWTRPWLHELLFQGGQIGY